MQIELPDIGIHTKIDVPGDRPMTDDEYFEFCGRNPELRIEREANGEILILPGCGFETGCRNAQIAWRLGNWARTDGRGIAADSSTEYLLPNGAARSPDASWVLKSRLAKLTREQMRRFLPLCPDFVVELVSPTDRIKKLRVKMHEWIDNGASLGWLIDADRRTVYVYGAGQEPEELVDIDHIDGEGPVAGFRLELARVWRAL